MIAAFLHARCSDSSEENSFSIGFLLCRSMHVFAWWLCVCSFQVTVLSLVAWKSTVVRALSSVRCVTCICNLCRCVPCMMLRFKLAAKPNAASVVVFLLSVFYVARCGASLPFRTTTGSKCVWWKAVVLYFRINFCFSYYSLLRRLISILVQF